LNITQLEKRLTTLMQKRRVNKLLMSHIRVEIDILNDMIREAKRNDKK